MGSITDFYKFWFWDILPSFRNSYIVISVVYVYLYVFHRVVLLHTVSPQWQHVHGKIFTKYSNIASPIFFCINRTIVYIFATYNHTSLFVLLSTFFWTCVTLWSFQGQWSLRAKKNINKVTKFLVKGPTAHANNRYASEITMYEFLKDGRIF